MTRFLLRRVRQALVVCLGISGITFVLLFVAGDPVHLLLPPEATKEDIRLLREKLGLDRPLVLQYARFLGGMARLDFGTSLFVEEPAMALVLERMPATLELTVAGLAIALLIAVPLGVLSAVKRFSAWDNLATLTALTGQAMPVFWVGIMLIILFAVTLRWLPASGRGGWEHLILPALALGAYQAPITMRLTRSGMAEVLGQDYIRTARSKGVVERGVLWRHALRNAAIPVVTILGLQFGRLMGGAILTETVFAWPGVASLAVKSIQNYDYPVVQASVVLLALIIVVANLLADLAVASLDPRIRFE
jgi:ABC-type dipeptide/oligopeptide/nickel transport system permease component